MRFTDQHVVVTGGTRGLGRAITCAFLAEGAVVHATYRSDEQSATALCEELGEAAERLHLARFDVASYDACESFWSELEGTPVSVLVNNAGLRRDAATAERAAHSLKGAAGTLGAAPLAEAAAEAEIAIRTGSGEEQALASLSVALDQVLEAIRTALPEDTAGDGAGQARGDPAAVLEPLTRLKQLLETDDGEAADFMVDAQSHLASVLTPAEIKALTERVGKFDFEAALKCLSGIASRLSLTLEGK